ncbi:hypothetical protein EHM92_02535 [bacterium]|nr:MAG: hypothetical protein EHM92_02535 [bacterium]
MTRGKRDTSSFFGTGMFDWQFPNKDNTSIDHICDIGLATSDDGIRFVKDTIHSPFFRTGPDRRYSYEDVNNQWDWERHSDHRVSGTLVHRPWTIVNYGSLKHRGIRSGYPH